MAATTNHNATRYAIVTGGGSGIGRALCRRLAEAGWAVAVADRDAEAAERVAAEVADVSPASHAATIDVARAEGWQRLIDDLRQRWPRLDLLVNNAGTLVGGAVAETPPAELQRLVEVNLTGTMLGSAAAAPWLIEAADRGAPRGVSSPRSGIINTASIFAPLAPPGFAAYSATKAGVVAFSRALRGELATSQLNVTVTLPGVVGTRLFGSARFATPAFKAAAERFVQQTELSPESVAEQTLRAAHRGLAEAVLGRRAGRFASLRRWAPALADYLVQRRATRELGLAAQRSADDPPNNASPVTAADQPTVARSQAHGKTCST